jgi:hypothetical protein
LNSALIDRSSGEIRADVVHGQLVEPGYQGSSRTTRQRYADAKHRLRREHRRIALRCTSEPGLCARFNYDDGPIVKRRKTVSFCPWRFRVVVPLPDETLPSVVIGIDPALCAFDGRADLSAHENEQTASVCAGPGFTQINP